MRHHKRHFVALNVTFQWNVKLVKLIKITFISYGGVPKNGHQDRTRVFPFVFSNVLCKREIKFRNVNDHQKWFSKICV